MTMTDPIADMLTRIRNALRAAHETVDMPNSKVKRDIAKVLKSDGYIRNHKIISDGRHRLIRIFLKYDLFRIQRRPEGVERIRDQYCFHFKGAYVGQAGQRNARWWGDPLFSVVIKSRSDFLIGGLNVTYRQKAHCHTKGC